MSEHATKRPSILVVDDEPDIVEYLCVVLQDHGFNPVGVSEPAMVLAMAARSSPDAILLDIMMPGQSGYSLYRDLLADEQRRKVPVFFLSGCSRGDSGTGAPALPPDLPAPAAFFDKPVDVMALIGALWGLLGGRAPMTEGREAS
jgi:CheY-like chemotaxis protein